MIGRLVSSAVAQLVRSSSCPRFQPGDEGNPLIDLGDNSSMFDEESWNRFLIRLFRQKVIEGQAEVTTTNKMATRDRYKELVRHMQYVNYNAVNQILQCNRAISAGRIVASE
mmetsp:Transcript_508/g.633  ORF Transcript_508/g.633 Transcript_508/m.633 type:complete len:112 (-) Transcript_508:17-352(-)